MVTDLSGIVLGMPEAEYHADPALSSTGAKLLLKSPLAFDWNRTHPKAHKPEFDLGSASHSMVLGVGYDVVVLDFPDFRTKLAQQARDEAYAEGKIPVLKKTYAEVFLITEAVLAHPKGRELLEQKARASEVSVFATDPEFGIQLRARFDGLAARPFDLKTTGTSADADTFSRTIFSFGYDVSRAHYLHTLELVTGERREMAFLVVETNGPYDVGVHYLDPEYAEIGEGKARRARQLFAECMASGKWPGHSPEATRVKPPMYAIYDYQDNYS